MARAWHERRDLPWSKVWMDWWTSLSHAECSAATIGIGIYLQTVANQRGREDGGAGWVVGAGGRPMSIGAIARGAHATVDEVKEAVAELLEAGTLVQRDDDGALGFPNLQRYQESASAARKRNQRGSDESEECPPESPGTFPGQCEDGPGTKTAQNGAHRPTGEVGGDREASSDAAAAPTQEGPASAQASGNTRETSEPDAPDPERPRTVPGHSADSPAECPPQRIRRQTSEDQKIRGQTGEGEDGSDQLVLAPPPASPSLADYVAAWNRGRAEAAEDLGRAPNISEARAGAPPKALSKAVKRYANVDDWRWCAYALATSWKATQPDAFDGYGLAWVARLTADRLESEMLAGARAREQGRKAWPAKGPASPSGQRGGNEAEARAARIRAKADEWRSRGRFEEIDRA